MAGTTAAAEDGGAIGGEDIAEQTREALRRIVDALEQAGATLQDVVHGEFFRSIRPATSMVEVSNLIDPTLLVEIEADAIVPKLLRLPPRFVKKRLVRRHQPALRDTVTHDAVDADSFPLAALPVEFSGPAGEVEHDVISDEHPPLDEAQRRTGLVTPPLEVTQDLMPPLVTARDGVVTRYVPDDVLGQDGQQFIGRSTTVKSEQQRP